MLMSIAEIGDVWCAAGSPRLDGCGGFVAWRAGVGAAAAGGVSSSAGTGAGGPTRGGVFAGRRAVRRHIRGATPIQLESPAGSQPRCFARTTRAPTPSASSRPHSSSTPRADVEAGRRFGARVDLQFGRPPRPCRASPANEPRPEVYRHVWQAYGTYLLPGRANGLAGGFRQVRVDARLRNQLREGQPGVLARVPLQLPAVLPLGVRLTLPVTDGVSLLYMLTNGIQQTEDFNDFKSNHFAAVAQADAPGRRGR